MAAVSTILERRLTPLGRRRVPSNTALSAVVVGVHLVAGQPAIGGAVMRSRRASDASVNDPPGTCHHTEWY